MLSSDIAPQYGEYERTSTAVLTASVGPVFGTYLHNVEKSLHDRGVTSPLWVMQSNGGLTRVTDVVPRPLSAELSGPAGGVMSAIAIADADGIGNFVTFDVGGTSTDVALVVDGQPSLTDVRVLQGQPSIGSTIDIVSVGAGGGSMAWIDTAGLLKVGPRSAGSKPGPACYGRGGDQPTVTDAQLHLGHMHPYRRATSNLPLQPELSERVLSELAVRLRCSTDEAAAGIMDVQVSTMVRALRRITIEQGVDPRDLSLLAFGGGGPLYACRLLEELELKSALVPPSSGTLSATGLLLAGPTTDIARSHVLAVTTEALTTANAELNALGESVWQRVIDQGCPEPSVTVEWSLDLRYVGQSHKLTLPVAKSGADPVTTEGVEALVRHFHDEHERRYGVKAPREPVEIVTLRARASGEPELRSTTPVATTSAPSAAEQPGNRRVFMSGAWHETTVALRDRMSAGSRVEGPAVIESDHATVLVLPGFVAELTSNASVILTKKAGE